MTHSSHGSPDPFDATRPTERLDGQRRTPRPRRISIPIRMDDGEVRSFALPSALDHPSQFSPAEFERLTRAYAEALGLLGGSDTPNT